MNDQASSSGARRLRHHSGDASGPGFRFPHFGRACAVAALILTLTACESVGNGWQAFADGFPGVPQLHLEFTWPPEEKPEPAAETPAAAPEPEPVAPST